MKFPRNATILRSQFDVAPFAAVFFLVIIFFMLGLFLPVPGVGVSLQPPQAANLPGTDKPSVGVAIDSVGRLYFRNQMMTESQLQTQLRTAMRSAGQPLTLVIHADKSVTYDQLLHLTLLARNLGITNALLATLPRVAGPPSTQ